MRYPRRIKLEQLSPLAGTGKKPRVITFDAYNTLYSTTLPVMEQYSRVGKKYGINTSAEKLAAKFPTKINIQTMARHTGISPKDWWGILISDVFAPIYVPQKMIVEILHVFDGFGAYTVYPDLLEFLKLIKQKYPEVILGVLSNTDPIMYTLLKNIGLEPYFDSNVYLSYDLEVAKPDPKFFELVLQNLVERHPELIAGSTIEGLKSCCWHVGDEDTNDLQGPYNAGWNAVLIDRTDKYKHLSETSDGLQRQTHALYTDKIDNNASESWGLSMKQTDAIQLSDCQYVVSNFRTLTKVLFE
ncbi:LANO_0H02762g1_1 [Lachancea nothofagi CBS 11611]|uniref:LANO_0H02762g1_1 n=1 Tax=Lachancea nothofagi CBS 11611 TaxID=1266666 RepID=A0A1G4KLE9_9SACH|nr:LANO_0H02762g1_1 [Lachancea nothofagi CBS 11611]